MTRWRSCSGSIRRWSRSVAVAGRPALRKRQPGFEGLAMIIVSQQVSVASAAAIWKRVRARFEPMEPATILAATEDDLRACGLSAPKIRTMRAVAQAIHAGEVPLADLPDFPPMKRTPIS